MDIRHLLVSLPIGTALLGLFACSGSTPTSPTAPTVGDPVSWVEKSAQDTSIATSDAVGLGVTLVTSAVGDEMQPRCDVLKAIPPGTVSPLDGVVVGHGVVVLIACNATWKHADQVPGLASLPFAYQFELYEGDAEAPLFARSEPEGPNGTTTHTVAERLLSDDTAYRWRVMVEYGEYVCGSEVVRFRTPRPSIAAPTPVSPPDRTTDVPLPVELRVENGATSGKVGAVTMRYEVAPTPAFNASDLLRIAPVPAGGRHTSVSVPAALATAGTKYYWRASAHGAGGIESEYSDTWSFTTAGPPPLGSGDGIDPSEVRWLHTNVSDWPQTSTITDIRVSDVPAGGICIEHTQSESWPGVDSRLGTEVAGNAWVFANIGGVWYGATYEWLRPGQICKLTVRGKHDRPSVELGPHTKQSPLTRWVPRTGEQVGFMVSTLARFGPEGDRHERSDIVVVTWP